MSEDFDITLASLNHTKPSVDPSSKSIEPFNRIVVCHLPRWRSWINSGLALLTGSSLQLAYYRSEQFNRLVIDLSYDHDIVLAHMIRTAPYALRTGLPAVLEMTDAVSLGMERTARVKGAISAKRWIYAIEANRARRYERSALGKFGIVSIVSAIDRQAILADNLETSGRILVVPNGVERVLEPSSAEGSDIVFVGNMATIPNQDALRFFIMDVLPAVVLAAPDVRLRVIGPLPRYFGRWLSRQPNVNAVGEVDSISRAMKGAVVGVCPVFSGSGIQNKVLDYLAHGLATVTSSVGLEGIAAKPGKHLLKADSTSEWIAAVSLLILDRTFAQQLGATGRELVISRYDWAKCVAPLAHSIRNMLKDRPLSSMRPSNG